MPLRNLLVCEAHQRLIRSGDPSVVAMPVGQVNQVRPVAEVIVHLLEETEDTLSRLDKLR